MQSEVKSYLKLLLAEDRGVLAYEGIHQEDCTLADGGVHALNHMNAATFTYATPTTSMLVAPGIKTEDRRPKPKRPRPNPKRPKPKRPNKKRSAEC